MVYVYTVIMYSGQAMGLCLMAFLAYRYRENIARVCNPGPKALWSRIFVVFIVCATLVESLTWTFGYLKCLDTSDTLVRTMSLAEAERLCRVWEPLGTTTKHVLFMIYLAFEFVAVTAFQALVLERYRKVSHLFPYWMGRYAFPIYSVVYVPIGVSAYVLSCVEIYASPSTIISRNAVVNSLSSACYCVWIASTGFTDAILSFLIVTKVRHFKKELHQDEIAENHGLHRVMSSTGAAGYEGLKRLQIFFAIIILFDFCILSLTAVKKSNGIHGHVFAYEIASFEIGCTLLHCTLTLCFIQMLGAMLRQSQPQFEFVISPSTPTQHTWRIPTFSRLKKTQDYGSQQSSSYSTTSEMLEISPDPTGKVDSIEPVQISVRTVVVKDKLMSTEQPAQSANISTA